jgi:hypothetical protein
LRSDPLFQEPLAKNMISGFGYGREKLRKEGNLRVLVFQREGKYEGRETRAGGLGGKIREGKENRGSCFGFSHGSSFGLLTTLNLNLLLSTA